MPATDLAAARLAPTIGARPGRAGRPVIAFALLLSMPAVASAAPLANDDVVAPDSAAPASRAKSRWDLRDLRGVVADQPGLDAVTPGRWLPVPDGDRPWSLGLETYGQYTDAGDLEMNAGNVSVLRAGLNLRLDAAAIGTFDWSLAIGYEHSSYDFTTGSSPLIGGTSELVDDVQSFDVSWDFTLALDEKWSLFGGVGALIAGESGADFSDMLYFGGRFGGAWRASDRLALGFGVFVRESLSEDVELLPLFLVDWRFAEDRNLSLEGSQVEVAWTPSDDLRLAGFLAFDFRLAALADDGVVPNGQFSDDRFLLGLSADWRPADDVLLRASLGAVLSQEFDVEDMNGNDVVEVEADGAGLVASLGLSIRF